MTYVIDRSKRIDEDANTKTSQLAVNQKTDIKSPVFPLCNEVVWFSLVKTPAVIMVQKETSFSLSKGETLEVYHVPLIKGTA